MQETKTFARKERLTPQTDVKTQHQGRQQIIRLTSQATLVRSPTHPIARRQNYGGWRLSLFLPIAAILVAAGSGIGGLWLMQRLPWQNCQTLAPMAADSERLYCAQLAAQSGEEIDLINAIALVESWDSDRPFYLNARKSLDLWSQQLWQQAQGQMNAGNLPEAVRIASLVSPRSSDYTFVQNAIARWQEEWQKGEEITQAFDRAFKDQDWPQALTIARQFSTFESDYWRIEREEALMLRLARRRSQSLERTIAQEETENKQEETENKQEKAETEAIFIPPFSSTP